MASSVCFRVQNDVILLFRYRNDTVSVEYLTFTGCPMNCVACSNILLPKNVVVMVGLPHLLLHCCTFCLFYIAGWLPFWWYTLNRLWYPTPGVPLLLLLLFPLLFNDGVFMTRYCLFKFPGITVPSTLHCWTGIWAAWFRPTFDRTIYLVVVDGHSIVPSPIILCELTVANVCVQPDCIQFWLLFKYHVAITCYNNDCSLPQAIIYSWHLFPFI